MSDGIESRSFELPDGFHLTEVFPRTSAFKQVFKAEKVTPLGSTTVVLKRIALNDEEIQDMLKKFGLSKPVEIVEKDAIAYWAGPLTHTNLVPCDVVQNRSGEIFLVEPFLQATLDKRLPASHKELWDWCGQLLAGLEYLHKNGYVHSDVKPDNMGLLHERVVLLDFGIATRFGESGRTKSNPGSIKTRPPELFGEGVKPTPDSDIWSLGASMYFFLTGGDYPFLSKEEVSTLPPPGSPSRQHFEDVVRRRSQIALRHPRGYTNKLRKRLNKMEVARPLDEVTMGLLQICPPRTSASNMLEMMNFGFGIIESFLRSG